MPAVTEGSDAIVGRDEERQRIAAALTGPDGTGAGAVVIVGPAGAGKTVLAHDAASRLPNATVFAGAGIPFATLSVPFLALRAMLHGRRGDADAPQLDFDAPAPQVLLALDEWIDELAIRSRVVLVVDDLHVVDSATLDVLLYLISGPADRDLSIIATMRDDESAARGPAGHWLANARRMPRCEVTDLGPLDRAGTEEQIALLMGTSPHESLVEDVWTRTGGFPYLTALAVAGLDPHADHLPMSIPDRLADAVSESIAGLGDDVLTILRLMALSGRSMTATELSGVMATAAEGPAPDSDEIEERLAHARDSGAIVRAADGTYGFRHPLTAEVLARDLSDKQRREWHSAFVRLGDEEVDPDALGFEEIGRHADHAAGSGDAALAYRWAIRAHRRATDAGAHSQALEFVERALALRPAVPSASDSEWELLQVARASAAASARLEREIDIVDRLLAIARTDQALDRSELTARRMIVRRALQRGAPEAAELGELLTITEGLEDSWQHAYALAFVSIFSLDRERALAAAAESLERAGRCGDDLAIAWSRVAAMDLAAYADDTTTVLSLGAEAIRTALNAGDGLAHNMATEITAIAVFGTDTAGYAESVSRRRSVAHGVLPHHYVAWLALLEAQAQFQLGRWDACASALRFTIGAYPGRVVDMLARTTAARLATRQGRFADADGHFARIAELIAGEAYIVMEIAVGRVELLLDRGDPLNAARVLASAGGDAAGAQSAHALLARYRTLADARVQLSGADLEAVEAIVRDLAAGADEPADFRAEPSSSSAVRSALDALVRAEEARAGGAEDSGAAWSAAADAAGAAEWVWEEAYSCRRAAEAMLLDGRADRGAAAPYVRRGLGIARRIRAGPLVGSLLDLARFARIPVDDPSATPTESAAGSSPSGFTPRETEIVRLIVAGRTYREIATELFLSEKTVSSHVSNMLRKTGAANRVDLARRASAVTNPTSA